MIVIETLPGKSAQWPLVGHVPRDHASVPHEQRHSATARHDLPPDETGGEVDYYERLGVLPSAEDVLIRASYRALSSTSSHTGSSERVQVRLDALSAAYAVLSTRESRHQYDELRRGTGGVSRFTADSEEARIIYERAAATYDERWATALEYYPDLTRLAEKLRQTSCRLAFAFQVLVLEKKHFNQRSELARQLHDEFFKTYFGADVRIVLFARLLIALGEWAAATDLNRAVYTLGGDIDVEVVIERVEQKFGLRDARPFHATTPTILDLAKSVLTRARRGLERTLFERLGGRVTAQCARRNAFGWPKERLITAALWGEQIAFTSFTDFRTWVREDIAPEALALLQKMDFLPA